MIDVTALGEILIDFTPCGAPANVLACLNKCGKETAFIGKVGDDMHGLNGTNSRNDHSSNRYHPQSR